MQLIFYRKTVPNFGDELNAVLWPALLPGRFEERGDTSFPGTGAAGFVGIGTIIGMPVPGLDELHVFSSGTGNDPPDAWAAKRVTWWCVRGPVSARILGLDADRAITDGAILSPRAPALPAAGGTGGPTLVVPHWETLLHPGWEAAVAQAGFELLDPRGTPEAVIARIASAGLVLTESLHGAILADTYGVPWVAFAASGNFNLLKWVDWALTVEVPLVLHMLPPPSAGAVQAFGRPPAPWGKAVPYGAEEALGFLKGRITERRMTPLDRLKGLVKHTPLAPLLLNLSPGRTAAALTALAAAPRTVSRANLRAELADRMADRLAEFAAATR